MSTSSTPRTRSPSAKPRRTHNKEYKQEALKLAESIGAPQAADDLGIDRSLINAWGTVYRGLATL